MDVDVDVGCRGGVWHADWAPGGGGMFGAVESGRLGRVLVQEFGVGYRAAEDEGSGYLAGIIRDYWRR